MAISSYTIDACRLYFADSGGDILYSFDLKTVTVKTYDGGHLYLRDSQGNEVTLTSTLLDTLSLTPTIVTDAITACTGIVGGPIELWEVTAPSAGAANTVRIYAEDNGSGKTRLMAKFHTGAAQQIAIEP